MVYLYASIYFVIGMLYSLVLIFMMDTKDWKEEILNDPELGEDVLSTPAVLTLVFSVTFFWPYFVGLALKEWVDFVGDNK